MTNTFSEKEIENIFAGKKKRLPRRSLYLLYGALTILLVIVVYLVINAPSFIARVNYWYRSDFSPALNNSSTNIFTSANPHSLELADNTIYVERIGIKAPISWDVVNSPDITAKALENGTIHLAGTAHPGEIGNVFVTGHSSNYLWAPGKYKTVFAVLNKVVVGDKIYIKYQNKLFTYTVTGMKVIKPTDLSVLNQGKESILSLVTCTPVGTSINRLVIQAAQTSPDPTLNKTNSNLKNNSSMPRTR